MKQFYFTVLPLEQPTDIGSVNMHEQYSGVPFPDDRSYSTADAAELAVRKVVVHALTQGIARTAHGVICLVMKEGMRVPVKQFVVPRGAMVCGNCHAIDTVDKVEFSPWGTSGPYMPGRWLVDVATGSLVYCTGPLVHQVYCSKCNALTDVESALAGIPAAYTHTVGVGYAQCFGVSGLTGRAGKDGSFSAEGRRTLLGWR